MGSLTGAVASERVTEASKGSLSADRNRAKSIKAEGSLTARHTGRAGTKVGLSDQVECRVPQGKNLTRLTKKSAVSHIYIGKPTKDLQGKYGKETQIQLNDKLATAPEVMDYMAAEKKRMSAEDQRLMTVSIKADKDTKMGVITDVKQALRQAKSRAEESEAAK